MNNLKDIQVEEVFNKKIIPYLYVLVVMSFFHIYCYEVYGDDAGVIMALRPTLLEEIKFLPNICNGWSGRYIINPFIHLMMHFDYRVWLFFELLFLMCMFNMIKKYCLNSDRVPHLYMLAASMCTLTLLDYYEVGWRVVTITYIWVATAAMVACLTIFKNSNDKTIKWYMVPVYLILTLIAANKEEMAVMLVVIFAVALIISIKEKKKLFVISLQLCACLLSLFLHLYSPNNQVRYEMKMVVTAREHTFVDKIVIGVSTTFRHLIFEHNYAFLCLAIMLVMVMWLSKKDIIPRLVSLVPLILWFMTWIPGEIDYMLGTNVTGGPRIIATIVLGIVAVISICVSLYFLYGMNYRCVWLVTAFVASVAGRFVVGFGNSGWQRYERTYTFLYIVMLAMVAIIACDVWDKLTYRKKQLLFGVMITLGNIGIIKNILDLGVV